MVAKTRVRRDQLAKFRAVAGLTDETAFAARMGFNRPTIWRTLTGRADVSGRFIAALLLIFPKPVTFDDLFEVIDDDEELDTPSDEQAHDLDECALEGVA